MDVNRAHPHAWVESIFVDQDSAASKVGDVETVCEEFRAADIQSLPARAITCHFPAICLSMAPGDTRLGPGFQVKILMRVCASIRFRLAGIRLGLLVSNL